MGDNQGLASSKPICPQKRHSRPHRAEWPGGGGRPTRSSVQDRPLQSGGM